MPIEPCLFCGEVRPVGLFVRVCEPCWQTEAHPLERLDRIIAERRLRAKPGSLVYRGRKQDGPG